MSQRTRYIAGVARGTAHRATHPRGHPPADDATLVQKVRSEVLGNAPFRSTGVSIEAFDGKVTLRGQLPHPEKISALARDVAKVPGVRHVQNLVHMPGTPAPNKRDARAR